MPGECPTSTDILYRIGRAPYPLTLPPWHLVGSGRFDDPRSQAAYRVLYAGERRACFYESLADFRVSIQGVAIQGLTIEWLARRRIAAFRLLDPDGHGRWLDLASPVTYAEFRQTFRRELAETGLTDFDVSAAASDMRFLTQAIGLWTDQQGYSGIRYVTRHAPSLHCWAAFGSVQLETLDAGAEILFDSEPVYDASRTGTGVAAARGNASGKR